MRWAILHRSEPRRCLDASSACTRTCCHAPDVIIVKDLHRASLAVWSRKRWSRKRWTIALSLHCLISVGAACPRAETETPLRLSLALCQHVRRFIPDAKGLLKGDKQTIHSSFPGLLLVLAWCKQRHLPLLFELLQTLQVLDGVSSMSAQGLLARAGQESEMLCRRSAGSSGSTVGLAPAH
jgi:hypothetical protein